MASGFVTVPKGDRLLLKNGRVPICLVDGVATLVPDATGVAHVDIEIAEGRILEIRPAGTADTNAPVVDLDQGQVWPTFVDVHTHLDKGHIWPRVPNPDGSFMSALRAVMADRQAHWRTEDVRRRFDFSLRCAHAHGTSAIRSHLDSIPPQEITTWPLFEEIRSDWAGRIELQGVSLAAIEVFREMDMEPVADQVKRSGGIMGCVTYPVPDLQPLLDQVFDMAMARDLALDFHVDEAVDPESATLGPIAETAIRKGFQRPIQVGHCCSLSVQDEAVVDRTLDLVAQAGITVVSLPMCNMYLQDRHPGRTPRLRGVTLLHEFKKRGIPVSVASDNTRDPFYAYGDLDMHEVFTQMARIAHLDHPFGDWPAAVTRTPADVMELAEHGRLAAGLPANLVLFRGRYYSELLSRPQADRVVLRGGRPIDTTPPDYRELDDLFEGVA